jgi:cholesterol transport system auxiliary component
MKQDSFALVAPMISVLLTACSVLSAPMSEPATAVLIKLPVPIQMTRASGHHPTLLVLQPEVSPAYDTTRMAYSVKPYEIGYFRDNQWAGTPGQMIHPLLVQALQQTEFFGGVLNSPQDARSDYTLHTEVTELVQDFTVSPPVLRLFLHLQLFDASGQAIAGRDISEHEVMHGMTSDAGVDAANDAVADALRESAKFAISSAR